MKYASSSIHYFSVVRECQKSREKVQGAMFQLWQSMNSPHEHSQRDTSWGEPVRELSRAANKIHSLWLARTYPFAAFGKGVWIHRSCDLRRSFAKHIRIGNNVSIGQHVWINIAAIPEGDDPIIIFDDGCVIGRGSVISAKNCIHIGRNAIFGPSVLLTDHNHAFENVAIPVALQGVTKGGTVSIEEGTWIGFGAAIVCDKGQLVIGRNTVVGANSLITGSVAPYSVYAGNPARAVKHYDPSRQAWMFGGAAPRAQE